MKKATILIVSTLLLLSSSAFAAKNNGDVLSNTDQCSYASKTYSEGSVIDMGGVTKTCSGGEWVAKRGNKKHSKRKLAPSSGAAAAR